MIRVIATITTREGKRLQVLQQLLAVAGKVREEVGCLEYLCYIDEPSALERCEAVDERRITLVES